MLERLTNWFKKREYSYPKEFIFIEWSIPSRLDGVRGDMNKIIKYFFVNKHGFRDVKKLPYTQGIVNSFRGKVPIIDKTKMEEEDFPLFDKSDLSDISYKK